MADEQQGPALTWSAECAEIFAALAVAQSTMKKLEKGTTVDVPKKGEPRVVLYSYSYADLPASLGACLDAYNAAGCAVIQAPRVFPNGPEITTLITHKSGQWLMAEGCFVPAAAKGAQDVGSAITYARRYALQAIAGLAPAGADDDGKAAHDAAPDSWERSSPAPRRQQKSPDLGARCSGKKGGHISTANDRRAGLLAAEEPAATAEGVLVWGFAQAGIDVSKYGPSFRRSAQELTIADGIKLRDFLKDHAVKLGLEQADAQSEPDPPGAP